MRVWLVTYWHCGDCGQVLGVFDTPEKAQAALANVDIYRQPYCDIETREVQ